VFEPDCKLRHQQKVRKNNNSGAWKSREFELQVTKQPAKELTSVRAIEIVGTKKKQ